MIRLEETTVFGWESAIRGMRNPMNSWDKSDSGRCNILNEITDENASYRCAGCKNEYVSEECIVIGENDLALMKKLSKAGSDHAKFLRMINVTVDITAPRYWWIEFDTYKIGTVANSCSTMHKIHEKEFALDDFSCEHMEMLGYGEKTMYENTKLFLRDIVEWLNCNRTEFLILKDKIKNTSDIEERKELEVLAKKYWWQMIQLLPQSYNQKRTVQMNYQVLKNMYFARINHKLDEWKTFCKWCESLPYFKEVVINE